MRDAMKAAPKLGWAPATAAVAAVAILGPAFFDPSQEPARQRVIVQGIDLETAAERVRDAGGEITHRLGIIDAVGARLTAAQRTRLAASGAVRRIWEDRAVELATAPDTVRDEFHATTYSGNDGSASWTGNWQAVCTGFPSAGCSTVNRCSPARVTPRR